MAKFEESRPFAPPAHIQFKSAEKVRFEFIREATGATLALPLIAGVLAFAGTGLLVLALGWSVRWALGAAGLAVLAVGVYWTLDNRSIMSTTEVIEGADPPPTLPQLPAGKSSPWVMVDRHGNQKRGQFIVSDELLTDFLEAGYYRQSLAYGSWVPRFCMEFLGQGRAKYEENRKDFEDKGFAEDRKGNVGLALTDAGMAFAEEWLVTHGRMRQLEATPPPAALGTGDLE